MERRGEGCTYGFMRKGRDLPPCSMARKCFACVRVGSEDHLDIYIPKDHLQTSQFRWALERSSPSPVAQDTPDSILALERSPVRRSSSFHSSTPVAENRDENLLHPNISRETSGAFWRQQRQGLQLLSGSAPSVTCAPPPASPSLTPTTCRSRQKKFLRHFQVDPEEKVIDYYSCALVADILLQGHLYISKNYFAFYSNVFGYVTKLLIPTTSVVNITKEKTAFILPNAVGVATADNRHVFSSLISRDATYRLMVQVWNSALATKTPDPTSGLEGEVDGSQCEESLSVSGSESTCEVGSSSDNLQVPTVQDVMNSAPKPDVAVARGSSHVTRGTLLLAVSTVLLIALFLSASVLMYRLSLLQHSLSARGSRSLFEVQEYLDVNLNNLYKVRQSLETLSLLMENEKEKASKEDEHNRPETVKLMDSRLHAIETDQPQQQSEDGLTS